MADDNKGVENSSGLPNGGAFWAGNIGSAQEANALIERALEAASPNAIFQEPVVIGDTAVITCNELNVGVGVGYGAGGDGEGGGGGGGGGGGSLGRPVAVISIRPDGVKVEPIVDVTKLGIAALSALIALIMARGEVKRTLAGR
jgi:uncharacterized spore protein YtfJ